MKLGDSFSSDILQRIPLCSLSPWVTGHLLGIPRTGGAPPPLMAVLGIDLLQVWVDGLLSSVLPKREGGILVSVIEERNRKCNLSLCCFVRHCPWKRKRPTDRIRTVNWLGDFKADRPKLCSYTSLNPIIARHSLVEESKNAAFHLYQ